MDDYSKRVLNEAKASLEPLYEDVDIDYLIDAAEEGDEDIQCLVGMAYLYGIQLHRNFDKAVMWLNKSACQGICAVE